MCFPLIPFSRELSFLQFGFRSLILKVMGDNEAMVSEGYTSTPYGDYNASAATVESTGQEIANQSNAPNVDSSQSVNNASLVNGTGHEGGLSAPVENGNATDNVAVAALATEHGDQPGNPFFFLLACIRKLILSRLRHHYRLFCLRLYSFTRRGAPVEYCKD